MAKLRRSKDAPPLDRPPDLSIDGFWSFAAGAPVVTKDHGLVYISLDPSEPLTAKEPEGIRRVQAWGTQRYFIRELIKGRAEGIHQFFGHKGRQTGITEITQLFSAYVLFTFPGLLGAFIADEDTNTEYFRDRFTQMAQQTPEAPTCPHDDMHLGGLRVKNKNQLAWDNGSRLMWYYAGTRKAKKQKLGVSRGLAYLHATEVPIWLDKSTLTYLRSAFSLLHPVSIYVFEGTARGRNAWHDLWTNAHETATARALFAAWWMREDYALEPGSEGYRKYWDGRLTPREKVWQRALARRYDTELAPTQIAWRRQYVREQAEGDTRLADQEMPTLPEEAFEATGVSFLSHEVLRRCRVAIQQANAPAWYRYEFTSSKIETTRLLKTTSNHGTLAVWEEPEPAQGYVVAAVPAYAVNDDDPTYVVTVAKATRDTLTQVAEFSAPDVGMQPFAWVCLGLIAAYGVGRRAFGLETLGVGGGVLNEIRRCLATGWGTSNRAHLSAMMGGGIRHYMWRRPDSLTGLGALQFKSHGDDILQLMNRLRDQLANGAVTLRSEHCALEFERVRQEGNAFVPEGDSTSHHLHAASMLTEVWAKHLIPMFYRIQGGSAAPDVLSRTVADFFDKLRAQPARVR